MMIQVPLKALEEQGCNPFKQGQFPWFPGKPLTRKEVSTAIKAKDFEEFPVKLTVRRKKHIRRIAYLVTQGWLDAIEIDVGCPSFPGFILRSIIEDGHHRLAAAFYRRDQYIAAHVGGEIAYGAEILGVPVEAFDDCNESC